MPEIISCPSCRRRLQAPESVLGQDVQCPTCGTTFVATFGAPPAPPPSAKGPEPERERGDDGAGQPRGRYQDDYGLDDDYAGRGDRRPRPRPGWQPHRGPAILTIGILALVGLVICVPAVILGPIAWAMGNNDLAAIRSHRMDPEGAGATSAGHTCGIIATILGLIGIVLFCVMNDSGVRLFRHW
jgi:hypothetical protein